MDTAMSLGRIKTAECESYGTGKNRHVLKIEDMETSRICIHGPMSELRKIAQAVNEADPDAADAGATNEEVSK